MIDAPQIETERLVLRMPHGGDAAEHAAMRAANDGWDRETAWRSLATVIGHWAIRGFGVFSVITRQDGRFAGLVGLWRPEGWTEIELSWHLAPALQGRGLATEAAHAVRAHAAETLGVRRLVSYIWAENARSQAVAERLGATRDGRITLNDGSGVHRDDEIWRHPDPERAG